MTVVRTMAPYKPPYDLSDPDLSTIALMKKFQIRYNDNYLLLAFFSVTETKKNDEAELGRLFEVHYKNAVDSCPHLNDAEMKNALKESITNDGEKGWRRAKSAKAKALEWNSSMKPNEPLPGGTPDKTSHVLTKLLDRLWEQTKSTIGRSLKYEPAKCWSAYVLLELWDHPKCRAPTLDSEEKLRDTAIARKEQRKRERLVEAAENKEAKNAKYQGVLVDTARAKMIAAEATAEFVRTKRKEQRVAAPTKILQSDIIDKFEGSLREKLIESISYTSLAPSPVLP